MGKFNKGESCKLQFPVLKFKMFELSPSRNLKEGVEIIIPSKHIYPPASEASREVANNLPHKFHRYLYLNSGIQMRVKYFFTNCRITLERGNS